MPALPPQIIKAEADDGAEFVYKAQASVTNEGHFSLQVDERIESIVCRLLNSSKFPRCGMAGQRAGCMARIHADTLKDAVALLEAAAKEYITATEVKERVIKYGAHLRCSFYVGPDGAIHTNGHMSRQSTGGRNEGMWWIPKSNKRGNLTSQDQLEEYSVGLTAKVFDKITTKRSSGDTVRYEHPHDEDDVALTNLNSFVGLWPDPKQGDLKEMPYTPEAAEFFTGILLTICKMCQGLDAFIADDARLKAAIADRGQKALTWLT